MVGVGVVLGTNTTAFTVLTEPLSSFSNINASQIGACLSLISRGLKGLFLSVLSSFIVALWGERLLISYLVIAKSLLFEAIILSLC